MILGNTNCNNRGKKYLKNKNIDKTKCYALQAHRYNAWFESNIAALKTQLFGKYRHPSNEDIFNDTYVRIYERIYYAGMGIADYKSYFCRAFYTNYIQELSKGNRYANVDIDDNMPEDSYMDDAELENRYRRLEEDIFEYVFQHFDIREFEIFKMYMRLKIQGKLMNYEILSAIIDNDDYKTHHIQSIISKIKKKVAARFSKAWQNCSIREGPRLPPSYLK